MKRFIRRNFPVLIFALTLGLLLYFTYLKGYWPERGFLCPISYEGPIVIRNDSLGEGAFGAKRRGGRAHKGVDLESPLGTPVMAVQKGVVVEVGKHPRGYGNYIELRHEDGFTTRYAHLLEVSVAEGDRVYRGMVIGKVGKTGNAKHSQIKAHVHFEIRKDGEPVDPMEYIQEKQK